MITFDDDTAGRQIADFKKEEEEDVVKILAENKYNIPYIDLAPMVIDNEALRYISEKEARDNNVAPFKLLGKNLHVGMLTPLQEGIPTITEDLRQRGITPTYYMVSKASLKKVWERYGELSQTSNSRVGGMDIAGDVLIELGKELKSVADIKSHLDEMVNQKDTHKTSRLLEIILAGAIAINASDVHMEPEENFVRLRLRASRHLSLHI